MVRQSFPAHREVVSPLLLGESLDCIPQRHPRHRCGVRIEKLAQDGRIPLPGFAQHPPDRLWMRSCPSPSSCSAMSMVGMNSSCLVDQCVATMAMRRSHRDFDRASRCSTRMPCVGTWEPTSSAAELSTRSQLLTNAVLPRYARCIATRSAPVARSWASARMSSAARRSSCHGECRSSSVSWRESVRCARAMRRRSGTLMPRRANGGTDISQG